MEKEKESVVISVPTAEADGSHESKSLACSGCVYSVFIARHAKLPSVVIWYGGL